MPIAPASTSALPLPVRIFRAAMEKQLSLADYAQSLGISAEDLRATVTARPDQVETAVLDQLADVYNQPRETLRDQLRVAPPQESFGAWLKRNMDGISQHALRARVQVDAKTLKGFLNAGLLPDSDQAERISRALYIDRTEIARVVAANMVQQGETDRPAGAPNAAAKDHTPAPASEEATAPPSRRTRRQSAASRADHAGDGGTAEVAAEPAPEGERVQRPASRRQADAKTVDAAGEPPSEPEGDKPRRPAARRRTSSTAVVQATPPEASPSMAPVPAVEVEQPASATSESSLSAAPVVEGEMPGPSLAPMAEVEQLGPPAADSEAIPATDAPAQPTSRKRRRTGSAARQDAADMAAPVMIPDVEQPAPTTSESIVSPAPASAAEVEQSGPPVAPLAEVEQPGPPAADIEAIPATDAPAQPTTRKRRRAGSVAKRDAVDAAAPVVIPDEVETPTGEVAAEREPEVVPSATRVPTAAAQPAELAPEREEASPASDVAPAPVTAVLAADSTALQLTADEVRLIRHWRRLHPHGRRATLHYIGSLLVDD